MEYGDVEYERLLTDYATGKGQDIIAMEAFPLSVTQCVAKEMLEDLTSYYDNDPELSRDDLVEPVRKAMEHKGKMYYVTPDFNVWTLAAKKEYVGDCTGWSIEDMKALVDQRGDNAELFTFGSGKETNLFQLTARDFSDYIDWETGACSFDSDSFRYLLEVCNEKGSQDENAGVMIEGEEDQIYSRFNNGDFLYWMSMK